MPDEPAPNPHLEIERVDSADEAWRWSIYDGEGGPLLQRSERHYPSTDAARRVGDKMAFAYRHGLMDGPGEIQ